jgi:putative endonuclease
MTNWNNKVIYVGVTNNLDRRVYEHRNKLIQGFTKKYNLIKLVYFENFTDIRDALVAEKRIKGLIRAKKNILIESKNPYWKDLGEDSSLRSE